jgi:hypothetical protein
MKTNVFFILIISVLCCLDVNSEESIQLVQEGTSEYRIMLSNDASSTEVFAAQELQGYVMQASGAFMPMADFREPLTGNLIFVGTNAIAGLGLSVDETYLGEDGYVIKTVDRRIIIAGKSPRGTLFGVYAFLESIGCRWLAPGVNGEVIPINPNIAIPPLNRSERPAFNYRGFASLFPNTYKSAEWIDWMAKNRLNCVIVDSGVYDDFNQAVGGEIKRRGMYVGVSFNALEAITQDDEASLNAVTKKISEFIESRPDVNLIELYGKDYTDLLVRIANAINDPAKRISIRVDSESKLNSTMPKTVTFEPYLRCYRHSIDDDQCEINGKQTTALKALLKSSNKICLYEHYMASFEQNSLPFPILQTISEDMRYLNELKAFDGVISQCELDNWGTYGLNYYVFAKFSWNSRYNLGGVVDDYCDKYYGKASESMRKFFGLMEDAMAKMEHFSYIDPPELILKLLDEATLKELNIEIDGASLLAGDVVIFDRIRKLRLSMDYTNLLWHTLYCYIVGNEYQTAGDKNNAKVNLQKSLENGEELIKFLFKNVDEGIFIVTENFIFDYIEPIINDIRKRLNSL